MKKVKEITVYTCGDSSKISTWSNIPFFFTETLIAKEIKVNRVDIDINPVLDEYYTKYIWRKLAKINKGTTYSFFRSLTHFLDVKFRVWKALKQYPNADANIFLTFSFSSVGLTKKPTVLFGDWTYDHYFCYFLNRKPDFFEGWSVWREDRQINRADLVFPLFPSVADYMKERYTNKNIYYLGNVINSLYEADEEEFIEKKQSSNDLLFVGSKNYIEGVKILIYAFEILKKEEYPDLKLHIIGMKASDFSSLTDGVQCYGYLNKADHSQRELYYSLFQKAKIFINTTPKWGAFSATIEAMYFYIPVIVNPYKEFIKTFGENIKFGRYCAENDPTLLAMKIKEVLNDSSYRSLCINAHQSVKNYTWSAFIDNILGKIESVINK